MQYWVIRGILLGNMGCYPILAKSIWGQSLGNMGYPAW